MVRCIEEIRVYLVRVFDLRVAGSGNNLIWYAFGWGFIFVGLDMVLGLGNLWDIRVSILVVSQWLFITIPFFLR